MKKLLVCAAGVLLFSVAAFFTVKNLTSTPVIAFYGVEPHIQQPVEKLISSIAKKENYNFNFHTFDSTLSLQEQTSVFSKPVLIITVNGAPSEIAVKSAEKKAGLSTVVLDGMTSSIKETAVTKKGLVQAVPLLSDILSFYCSRDSMTAGKFDSMNNWKTIEAFIARQKIRSSHPVIFAGKDADSMLDFLGVLTEAMDNVKTYNSAAEILKDYENKKINSTKTVELLAGSYNAPLYTAVNTLGKWYKEGLISKDGFALKETDLQMLLKANLAQSAFITLAQHRAMENEATKGLDSFFIPSTNKLEERQLNSSIIMAVPVKKDNSVKKIIKTLASEEYQLLLARNTGLAPVNGSCSVPDVYSDNARFFVAATNTPLPPLSHCADLSLKQKQALVTELVSKIKSF